MNHALVVGGTGAIGRAIAHRLAKEGELVSVIGRRDVEGSDIPDVRVTPLDLADTAELQAALGEIVATGGALTSLVLLQRFRGEGDLWQGELDVSLTATKAIVDRAPELFDRQGGSIVVVCSNAARLVADEQPIGYHAAKAALRQMVRYYAVLLGPAAIRVNCVTPGAVAKEASDEYRGSRSFTERLRRTTPLRRIGTPEDVADAVALLCSPEASFVTGHELVVDGGLSLLWQESLIWHLAHDATDDA